MKKRIIILISFLFVININGQTLKDEWVKVNGEGCEVLDPYYSEGVTETWEGKCINGKADGYGILKKYSNGELESIYEGEYKNGIREGKGKFTHIRMKSVLECTFQDGQAIGIGTYTLEGGHRSVGEIVNYRRHGEGTFYYANGAKFEGFTVSDEFYTGKYTNYDGNITYIQKGYSVKKIDETKTNYKPEIGVRVTEYFDENWERCKQKDASFYRLVTYKSANKPDGIVKDYYMNGQLQSEFTAVYLDYDDEGKNFHEGEAIWYHKNGKIEQKRYYMNNNINGLNTFYYDNGQISSQAIYNLGILDGEYKQWYKTGKLKLVAFYEKGALLENKYIEYDENGVGAIVYKENFYKNKSNWEANYDESNSEVNGDNQLALSVKSDNTTSRFNYITLEQNSDYSIESILQKKYGKDNNGYGLLFGFKDWDNYYQFLISGNGMFMISRKFEGIKADIAEWTSSSYINKGNERNLLKVIKINDTFIFSINGKVVKRDESTSLRGNNFGMLVGGKGDYVLENITIKEFVTNDELASRTPNNSLKESDWKGNGTGFFIDKNGYLATNYHVVENANYIEVEFVKNGVKKNFSAKVIQTDKQNDLAIIKITDDSFVSFDKLPYNFKTNISDVGSNVFALGYPMALTVMGSEIKFTDGKISSKTGYLGDITTYQTTTPIQPGNSGGPLFDFDGNLIAINSAILRPDVADNVSYSIKSNYLKNLIDVLDYKISLPNDRTISTKTLTEKIKILSDYVVLIKVK
jgi:S1-C subfamily serine protease/antitoxin component YwqK of YwqJK toxin-antitoxin module